MVGDVGGLFDGLILLGNFLVSPVASIALKSKLLTYIFRSSAKPRPLLKSLSTEPSLIPKQSYFKTLCSGKRNKYQRILAKAEVIMKRSLDVAHFLKLARILQLSSIIALNPS